MFKVLMYGWEFPPHISGGLGVACHGIVSALADLQFDISLVLPCVENRVADLENIHFYDCRHSLHEFSNYSVKKLSRFVDVKSVDSLLSPYMTQEMYQEKLLNHQFMGRNFSFRKEDFLDFHGDYGVNLLGEVMRYALVAGAYAGEIEHDVIHAHDWLTILAGIEAKNISGKPLIFHVHALETDRNPSGVSQVVYDIEKYGMLHADKIIAVSQYTKNCIIKNYGINPEKIEVSYNGILPEQIHPGQTYYKPERKGNTVLFLGRVTQQKGPYFFLKAAKKVLEQRQDIEFVMAGNGDLWKDMIHQVAGWRSGSHIHFTKFLNKSYAEEIFRRSKIFVMPSVSEPFGLACLEAAGQYVPVVLSKQSGVSEVMNHCITVDFWDTDKIAEYIINLIDNPMLAEHIAQNSFEQLSNLLWSKQVQNIINVYSQVTSTLTP